MTEPIHRAPSLNNFLPGVVFSQNLPSCLCAHILAPRPGETVLDMCAAPGRLRLLYMLQLPAIFAVIVLYALSFAMVGVAAITAAFFM